MWLFVVLSIAKFVCANDLQKPEDSVFIQMTILLIVMQHNL